MRPVFSALAPLLLAGCTSHGVAPASSPVSAPDGFAFEVKSWGAPVHSWIVLADGAATSIVRVSDSGGPFPPYALEHRRFALSSDALARLRSLATTIPRPVPTDSECEKRMTDAAYGTLSLVRGGETEALAFYEGCFDAYYRPYLGTLKAMDAIVMDASKLAPVEHREEVGAESG